MKKNQSITHDELVIKYEMENSGLLELLNSECPRGLKPIETFEKYKKILRADKWFNGNIIGDIYGLEKHANWELIGYNYMFIPNKCNIKYHRKKIYGSCDLCKCNNRSQEIFQFENKDDDDIAQFNKAMDEFNGYHDYDNNDNNYYECKRICIQCLETTFQDAIITRFNLIRKRINK